MSGTYDLRRFYEARDFNDDFVIVPVHFLPTLAGPHLDVLRTRSSSFRRGKGRAETSARSWRLANVLGAQGIPNRVDPWGRVASRLAHVARRCCHKYSGRVDAVTT